MDPEDQDSQSPPMTSWSYLKMWVVRPLLRGLLFGVGHFLSFKLIGPMLTKRLTPAPLPS